MTTLNIKEKIRKILVLRGELPESDKDCEQEARDMWNRLMNYDDTSGIETEEKFIKRYKDSITAWYLKRSDMIMNSFTVKQIDAELAYLKTGARNVEISLGKEKFLLTQEKQQQIFGPYFHTSAIKKPCGDCPSGGCSG